MSYIKLLIIKIFFIIFLTNNVYSYATTKYNENLYIKKLLNNTIKNNNKQNKNINYKYYNYHYIKYIKKSQTNKMFNNLKN